jgi:NAD(P)-dependent dehydrogenase (short-subunit alcohol dehydrogenase family)
MVVLITGASGGLGGAVVKAFLASGAAAVYGVARSWEPGEHADPRFHPLTADLTSADECRRVAEAAGPADALIHLLGAFGGGDPVASTQDDVWNRMLDVNLKTSFQMFRAVLPGMLAARRGRILAIGSRAGVEPMPNFAAYSVSKAALIALVRATAQEVKDTDITANIVLPSTIDTPANRAAMPKADPSKWVSPESIADLLVWLASNKAANVNGAVIPIYGKA